MTDPDFDLYYHLVECWQKGCIANKPGFVCACSCDKKTTDCTHCSKLAQSIVDFFKKHPQYYVELALELKQ